MYGTQSQLWSCVCDRHSAIRLSLYRSTIEAFKRFPHIYKILDGWGTSGLHWGQCNRLLFSFGTVLHRAIFLDQTDFQKKKDSLLFSGCIAVISAFESVLFFFLLFGIFCSILLHSHALPSLGWLIPQRNDLLSTCYGGHQEKNEDLRYLHDYLNRTPIVAEDLNIIISRWHKLLFLTADFFCFQWLWCKLFRVMKIIRGLFHRYKNCGVKDIYNQYVQWIDYCSIMVPFVC